MFFKYVALLSFAATAIAGAISPGTYLIINTAYDAAFATVQYPHDPVFIYNTGENPGPYEFWDIRDAEDGGYTIQNVGLGTSAEVSGPNNGELVRTSPSPTVFNIESAGNGGYVIKLPFNDLFWNVEPGMHRLNIILSPAEGRATELWRFVLADNNIVHNYDRWDVPQRIPGRFLGHV